GNGGHPKGILLNDLLVFVAADIAGCVNHSGQARGDTPIPPGAGRTAWISYLARKRRWPCGSSSHSSSCSALSAAPPTWCAGSAANAWRLPADADASHALRWWMPPPLTGAGV